MSERVQIVPKPECSWNEIEGRLNPGDLVESPHPNPAMKDCWLYCCPKCNKVWTMRVPGVHQIVQREPLTVSPSWLCPSGCHYWIRNGEIVGA